MECVMKKNEKALTVAFTGGGGKTSLILGLAEIFSGQGRVIVTTTTHMAWEPERPFAEAEDIPGACRLIEQYGYVIAAHHKAGQPKISGPEKEILEKLPFQQESDLVKTAYAICRWHHERWDGRGYPDGLAGDDIPISAQIVSMADVYDALVSKRVYKAAYSPDTAVQMILHGDCGQFNPLLLECLVDIQDVLKAEIVGRENEDS